MNNSALIERRNKERIVPKDSALFLKLRFPYSKGQELIKPLYQLAQQGKIPASKVGRLWRFRKHKIDKWLDKKENNKQAQR